jgi:pimeloyl-ACP methyl ester carboxylesterase
MLALADVKLHRDQARIVAQMITDYRRAHPAQRFILTSHSAGCGIAAWALAQLPPDVNVDTWLMLEPALSPRFDLSHALEHVTGRAYAFSSANDVIVLSVGTRLMGTVDRVKTDAAGFTGFSPPATANPADYRKLVNVYYDTTWLRFGNVGDHIGCMFPPFVHNVIAPLLRTGQLPVFPPLAPATRPSGAQAQAN